jgi:type 1 glutamine amidotransferase
MNTQVWKHSTVAPMVVILAIITFIVIPGGKLKPQSFPVAEFSVHAGKYQRVNVPVTASIENVPLRLNGGMLQLYEITGGERIPVASQIKSGDPKQLTWIVSGATEPGGVRNYELRSVERPERMPAGSGRVSLRDDGESLRFSIGERNVLEYRYAIQGVPEGVDEIYSRGGYLHPIWSPGGEILSRIQPPDHYHHYGIWNPWTHTEFEGREIDFWNLAKGEGTVQPRALPERINGEVFGRFRAVHDHVDFSSPDRGKVALNEQWDVVIWNADPESSVWLIDFVSVLNPATEEPFTIKEYRYQGFSLRATEKWNDENAALLTSEGYDKSNANGTRARWIDVNGVSDVDAGSSGILFMSNPGNYNFPEQLRIWPVGMNDGVENVFINFNPAQDRDWRLETGQSYTLKYRMLVYDGTLDPEEAERYWRDFADPPRVETTVTGTLYGANVLIYTRNGDGYVHDNIPASIEAIERLSDTYGFSVTATEDPTVFTDESLARFDVIIFSNTNNDVFDTDGQRQALKQYIRGGGGFVGIHSASGTERNWAWFTRLVGGRFVFHPPQQDFVAVVADRSHPSTSFLPKRWNIVDDEPYYHHGMSPSIRVLLSADLSTVSDNRKEEYLGNVFSDNVPIAWYQEFDGGRQWFTSLGHKSEHYNDELFMRHVLGGLQWAVGGTSAQ